MIFYILTAFLHPLHTEILICWSDLSTEQASENFLIHSLDYFSLETERIKLHKPMSFSGHTLVK